MKKLFSIVFAFLASVAMAQVAPQEVYGVFPPDTAGATQTAYTTYVMPQKAIAGVTDTFTWGSVETTTDPTTQGACGANTDVCQRDTAGYYHTYNWSSFETTFGFWASTTSGWGTKKVNVLPVGQQETIDANQTTPRYVDYDAAYIAGVGGTQHYINGIKDTCTTTTSFSVTASRSASSNVATLTGIGSSKGVAVGDTIWIGSMSDSTLNVTTQAGTTVTAVTSNTVSYISSGTTADSNLAGVAVTSNESWHVPTDPPYSVGFQAFINATIYHLNQESWLGQIGYVRFGPGGGSENYIPCPNQLVNNQSITTPSPGYTSQANVKTTWDNWTTTINADIAAANPNFQIIDPVNPGWITTAYDYTYTNFQAASAVSYTNAMGKKNGFGGQGSQQADIYNYGQQSPPYAGSTGAPYCGSNWCPLFYDYWVGSTVSPGSQPLELQQIDCSDPTAVFVNGTWSSGQTGLSCGSLSGGKSKTGDLRTLLPFEKTYHTNVYEVYTIDLLLAYAPTYCVLSGSSCGTGSVNNAVYAMRCVGPTSFVDATCPNGTGGDGTYASTINSLVQINGTQINLGNQTKNLLAQGSLGGGNETALGSACTGSTTWNIGGVGFQGASLTTIGGCILNISNPATMGRYFVILTQGGGGTLSLGSGCAWKVIPAGGGTPTSTVSQNSTTGAEDILSFTYDGTNCLAAFTGNSGGSVTSIANGGTNATTASAGEIPNTSSSTASAWTNQVTLGVPGNSTDSFLNCYGSTGNSNKTPCYHGFIDESGAIATYLYGSTTFPGEVAVASIIPTTDVSYSTVLFGPKGVSEVYTTGSSSTLGLLQCPVSTSSNTVSDCASNSKNFFGVAAGTGNSNTVDSTDGYATVNIPSSTTNNGDYICSGTLSAGTYNAVDNGSTQCPSGQQVGFATQYNASAVTSVLVHLTSAGGVSGGSSSVPFSSITTGTNTSTTLTVGTNSHLTYAGNGTINANEIGGSTIPQGGNQTTVCPWLTTNGATLSAFCPFTVISESASYQTQVTDFYYYYAFSFSGGSTITMPPAAAMYVDEPAGVYISVINTTTSTITVAANSSDTTTSFTGSTAILPNSTATITYNGGNSLGSAFVINNSQNYFANSTTNHGIPVGNGTTFTFIPPSSTVNQPLCSQGASSNPAYCGASLPASGTPGGINYYSSSSALSSSAALAQYAVVQGGGSGGAPTTGNNDFTIDLIAHTLKAGVSGLVDFSGATGINPFKEPVQAGFTASAPGSKGYDSTNKMEHTYTNTVDSLSMTIPSNLNPTNNDCTKFVVSGGTVTLGDAGAGCGTGSGGGGGSAASFSAGVALTTSTVYQALFGVTNASTPPSQVLGNVAQSVSQLSVNLGTALSSSQTLTVSLCDVTVSSNCSTTQAVSCTVPNSGTTCNDPTHSYSVPAGDKVVWKIVLNSSTVTESISIGAVIGAASTYSGNTSTAVSANSNFTSANSGNLVTIDSNGNAQSSGNCYAHYHPIAGSSDQITSSGTFATTASVGTNCLAAGSLITVRAHGVYTTSTTTAPKAYFSINAGSTTGICPAPSTGNLSVSITNGYWELVCYIQINTTGSGGTAVAWGNENYSTTNGGTNQTTLNFVNNSTGTVTYNTSTAETVSISAGSMVSGQSFNLTALDIRVEQ